MHIRVLTTCAVAHVYGKLKHGETVFQNLLSEIGVGFALLLPLFFGLDGVLYSMPVSDLMTAVISAIIIAMTYRQLSGYREG